MSKKRKTIYIFVVIMIIIIVIITVIVQYNFHKAIEVAQNHLEQKYTQKMKYIRASYSWILPSQYYITFSPKNNPDIFFEVMVQSDFTANDNTNQYGYFSADNYYISFFEYLMKKFYWNDVVNLWGKNTNFIVRVPNNALYAFSVPPELNNTMSLNEMENLIDNYLLIIDTKQKINNNNKLEQADKIFEFIKIVQNSGYNPNRIVIWYNTPNSNVSFDDWREIDSVAPILLRINEDFFSTVNKSDEAYYKKYFSEELAKKFKKDAERIWNTDVNITAKLNGAGSVSDYKIYGLTKDINIDDIEYKLRSSYYSYSLDFILPIDCNKNSTQKFEEATKVYELIKIIQESGYEPQTISFTYFYPDNYKQHYIVFFAGWGDVKWTKVDSIESVMERFNGLWFDK